MNWKNWLRGLAAVAVGGAATGVADAAGQGQINKGTAATAAVGALVTVIAYLLRSPILQPALTQAAQDPTAGAGAAQPK